MTRLNGFKSICRLFKDFVKKKKEKKNALIDSQNVSAGVIPECVSETCYILYHTTNNATTKFVEIC